MSNEHAAQSPFKWRMSIVGREFETTIREERHREQAYEWSGGTCPRCISRIAGRPVASDGFRRLAGRQRAVGRHAERPQISREQLAEAGRLSERHCAADDGPVYRR